MNFNYVPWREKSEKLKKSGWKYGAGAGPLKRGRLTFFLFNFLRLIIFTFRNQFTFSGPILENKGMRAIFQKMGKKGQNI